tara:strand:+ start:446 stop:1405 length:960 start_codon:yes stop_codon:yes gene_type:complete
MKHKEILVFGATGQIGRNLIRKLTKNNYKVTAVTRNIHRAGYILKTQANPGYLRVVEIKNFKTETLEDLIKNCSICINLVGILYEKKQNHFKTLHTDLPDLISLLANKFKIEKLIHLSALGVENAADSKYALSKFEGEKKILKNFKQSIILKPSIVYSVDDKFSTRFMTLLSRLPIMPIYYEGKTKFAPIHVTDLIEIILQIIEKQKQSLILECIGPETLTFKEIILKLLKSINKKRLLLPLPLPIAALTAKFLQLLPNPLLTEDQLNLLKYDNINSGINKTNFDLGILSKRKFEQEINKYSFNWRTGGQFSKLNNSEK